MVLFYRIADAACAAARKAVLASAHRRSVEFRNIHNPESLALQTTYGGGAVPALWDGARLHEGLDAIIRFLEVAVA
jgi:hypothetical protein